MILYSRYGLRIAEVYFDAPAPAVGVDLVRWMERSSRLAGSLATPFHTLWIDLERGESELLAAIDKGARYEIRRAAQKDGLACALDLSPGGARLDEFCQFYNCFARGKHLGPANRPKLRALAAAGMLGLSGARRESEPVLVWHAYVLAGPVARLLHSASLAPAENDAACRQLIGRANRLLHWQDITGLQARGFKTLDMGGWYTGTQDAARLRINDFKSAFGGTIVQTFNCAIGATWRGKAALAVLRVGRGIRERFAGDRNPAVRACQST